MHGKGFPAWAPPPVNRTRAPAPLVKWLVTSTPSSIWHFFLTNWQIFLNSISLEASQTRAPAWAIGDLGSRAGRCQTRNSSHALLPQACRKLSQYCPMPIQHEYWWIIQLGFTPLSSKQVKWPPTFYFHQSLYAQFYISLQKKAKKSHLHWLQNYLRLELKIYHPLSMCNLMLL